MDSQAAKLALRHAIKERLVRLSPKDRSAESRSICRRIMENLPAEPSTICAFFPMGDEADIKSLLIDIPARGHVIYLPRKEGKHFVFRKMDAVDALKPDDFGIPAPAVDSPLLEPENVTIALVPGRAFDRTGNRMGRGNGGYDIWIRNQRAANPKTQFWGICFECQLVSEVPMEAHDETVDAIVTARGLLTVK
ncbi:MAG: 5-formyltetrahydrofolate cyclo-ligase [Candidatus Peribacteraceae bacterium]|nr:5-formyltetrahydrofolate cyclo-ligase [Candidatus Peribacteraceae bacterium]